MSFGDSGIVDTILCSNTIIHEKQNNVKNIERYYAHTKGKLKGLEVLRTGVGTNDGDTILFR